jgi:hypothetical protein
MKNYNRLSDPGRTSRHRKALLAVCAVLALSSCGKSPERPVPPQGPPKPQVMLKQFSTDVQRAVYSYSSKPNEQAGDGQSVIIVRHVIHT